jgi:glutathione S-transferase
MTRPKLSYFDFAGSRGEDCRLALFIAGVDFEDDRVRGNEWPSRKPEAPYGTMPILHVPDVGKLGESNAILLFIGLEHGLLPKDHWELARHVSILTAVEDVRWRFFPTNKIMDADEKQRARAELTESFLKPWARHVDAQVRGPFVGGETMSVADIKLHGVLRWILSGDLDYVPRTVFADRPKLLGVYEGVRAHPRVREWYDRG